MEVWDCTKRMHTVLGHFLEKEIRAEKKLGLSSSYSLNGTPHKKFLKLIGARLEKHTLWLKESFISRNTGMNMVVLQNTKIYRNLLRLRRNSTSYANSRSLGI